MMTQRLHCFQMIPTTQTNDEHFITNTSIIIRRVVCRSHNGASILSCDIYWTPRSRSTACALSRPICFAYPSSYQQLPHGINKLYESLLESRISYRLVSKTTRSGGPNYFYTSSRYTRHFWIPVAYIWPICFFKSCYIYNRSVLLHIALSWLNVYQLQDWHRLLADYRASEWRLRTVLQLGKSSRHCLGWKRFGGCS
jgi:hypothetical protein